MNGATVYQMISGLGDAFGDAYSTARKDAQEAEAPSLLSNLMTAYRGGATSPAGPVAPAGPTTPAPASADVGRSLPTFAQGSDIGRYASAIQSNESGGKYGIVGPTHPKYGRALGAYQVMESNLPSWSREALGREVSPDEFLRSPQIQDAVFQTKFGQAVAKYGNPEDAASVWFTGRPLAQGANAKDVLGTTGTEYVRRFKSALGQLPAGSAPVLPQTAMRMPAAGAERPAPVQVADAANVPAPGAMPVGFTVPEGGAAAPSQAFPGFGAGASSRMTPELQTALNAAWKNPNTRAVAAQVFGQLLKGQDNGWELKDVNGQSAWVNGRDGRILPIGQAKRSTATVGNNLVDTATGEVLYSAPQKAEPTSEQRNFQSSLEDPRFQQFLDAQRRPLTPTLVSPGQAMVLPGESSPAYVAPPKVEGFTIKPGETRFENGQPVASLPDRDKTADGESKLRGEFTKQLGAFNDVQDAYGRVISAVQNRETSPDAKSPASDIALVFGFMKMLDPGSVVREGEYATAKNAAGVPEQVVNTYNKLLSGEFLNPQQRQDFVDTAGRVYGQARQSAEGIATRYRDLAKGQGLDEGRVVALPEALAAPKVAPKREGGKPSADDGRGAAVKTPPAFGQVKIPMAAVQALRGDPTLREQFDAKYGRGASDRALGREKAKTTLDDVLAGP